MRNLKADEPTQIGPYDIVGVLGEGGMGRVYLGRRGGQLVAVKMMLPKLTLDLGREYHIRFRREFEAAQKVESGFTAKAIEFGSQNGALWYACEYIAGPTLEEAVRKARFTGDALAQFAYSLYEALHAIHAAGIIHRDLKPSNIILGTDGVRVIDFGIATLPDEDRLTKLGQALGTPNYMSPEQTMAVKLQSASDIFAYGGLVVFAATGRPAFAGESALAIMHAIRTTEPNMQGVPADMQAIVRRCLAKDVASRATLSDIARMLPKVKTAQVHTTKWMPPPVVTRVEQAALAATQLEHSPRARIDPDSPRPKFRRAPGMQPSPPPLRTGEQRRYLDAPEKGRARTPDNIKPNPEGRPISPSLLRKRRRSINRMIVAALAVIVAGSAGLLWRHDGSFARLHPSPELKYLPKASFQPAKLTDADKLQHVAKIELGYRELDLTIKLDGKEDRRKTILLQSCLKVVPPKPKNKDDYYLFSPTEKSIDPSTNQIFMGLLDFAGDFYYTSPCESAYGDQKITNQTVVKLGTNKVNVKGLLRRDDGKSTLPVLSARVESGQLKVLLPVAADWTETMYGVLCLKRSTTQSDRAFTMETIHDKNHWKYKLLTFPDAAGTLYESCTRDGSTYDYKGEGVKLP